MTMLKQNEVTGFFDEAANKRPFLPNPQTLGGWGKYHKYQQAVALLSRPEVSQALDLGCNIGHVAYLYQKSQPKPGSLFLAGLDLSQPSLQRAKGQRFTFADFALASGYQLPFGDETFDLVVCIEVLEHVTEQGQLLQEVYRVLRPGATLYLTMPNPHCWPSLWSHHLHRLSLWLGGRPEAAKDHFLNRQQLAQLVRQAGFHHFDPTNCYSLPRPFMTWRGWVLFPPLPPRLGLAYQQFWLKRLGPAGQHLPLWLRDRLCHSLSLTIQKKA